MRAKADVARRRLSRASTAARPQHAIHEWSICEPAGCARLLDYDLVFSCVDRPWPRHVLNTLAYADLIPVIDGGLQTFQTPGGALRNAYWRSAFIRPGRPCLACLGQYDPAHVQLERDGSLDDPSYLANLPAHSRLRQRQNVAAFATSVAGALLRQFVSYVAHPSGIGDPGPLRFNARGPIVERETVRCHADCSYSAGQGCGDARPDPTGRHTMAERARHRRGAAPFALRAGRRVDDAVRGLRQRIARRLAIGQLR